MKVQRHAPCEHHVGLSGEQALTGKVDGNQGCGARALDGVTDTSQPKFVRDAGGQKIGTAGHIQLHQIDFGKQIRKAHEVRQQISIQGTSGEDSDRP